MFNRIPACEFWLGFPFEHDAYIASHGIEDYAHSAAQEIVSLRRLKQLRLGVYLVPSATVLAHRAYHLREVAAPVPVNWQQALIDSGQQPAVNEPPDEPLLIEFYHRDEEAESKFGPDTCSFCRDGFYEQSRALERSASAVMKAMVSADAMSARVLPEFEVDKILNLKPSPNANDRYAFSNSLHKPIRDYFVLP
ncbi:hypothetical protein RHS02_09282, partial [Rhizoctonia solani]